MNDTLNEQGLSAMAKRIDALDDALRERDRQLLLALFALREAKALLAYRDGQPGVWEHEHHEILELAENAKPNMEWAKVERRKDERRAQLDPGRPMKDRILAVGEPCTGAWIQSRVTEPYWSCRCGAKHPDNCITETAKA